jgi:hypothetical protein
VARKRAGPLPLSRIGATLAPPHSSRLDKQAFAMIERSAKGAMDVEAQLSTSTAQVQLVHYHFPEPPDSMLPASETFRVELCLTSRHRSSRACFRDRWAASRFEHIGDLFLAPPQHNLIAKSDESTSLTSVVCNLAIEPVLELFSSGSTCRTRASRRR